MQKTTDAYVELPGITDYLYESAFDDVHIMIFSTTKQYIGSSAPYPDRVFFFVHNLNKKNEI